MEEMNSVSPSLLIFPTEIIEKIFLHLTLSERENLRLTCKWFYELCSLDRFSKDEKIIWSEDLIRHEPSDLFCIPRCSYNLVIKSKKLEKCSTLPFFEKHGHKVHSLLFHDCDFPPGLLESIIMLCEGLCSLSLTSGKGVLDCPPFEPPLITRPSVTYLKLSLPEEKPYEFFHRMLSIIPNVKQLHIEVPERFYLIPRSQFESLQSRYKHITRDCSFFRDEIMKLGNNLECLELNIPLTQELAKNNFFEALPNLKDLTVNFSKSRSVIEKWYPCCSNLVSVKLCGLEEFHPYQMIYLLTNTKLKYLSIESQRLFFNEESFEELVASQLDSICFDQVGIILGLPSTSLDPLLETNKTVENLYLKGYSKHPVSTRMPFWNYFQLIHLSIHYVEDSNLQCIFQYQENLRSLKLGECFKCSIKGFCGTKDGSDYSINNLKKLEHLTIIDVELGVIQSEDFKNAINLSQLEYLCIWCIDRNRTSKLRYAEIPTGLFENLTKLRALRLRDAAMPPREALSSTLKKLKHLNYLRYDMIGPDLPVSVQSVTFIAADTKYFSISAKKRAYACTLGQAIYDTELGRMTILNAGLGQTFHPPKIGSFEIDWIDA